MTSEKAPVKKKVPKIAEVKKPLMIGGIVAAVAIAGIVIGINIIDGDQIIGGTLIVAIGEDYTHNDPIQGRWAFINTQIVETLFESEYTSHGSQIIYNLATGEEWSEDYLNYTCTLREEVEFHDGAPFNATAVQWNFDRMAHHHVDPNEYLFSYLFFLPDGRPIINKTQVVDNYTVRFVLNEVFVPFPQLLTHFTTSIVSPRSTPFNTILSVGSEELVGTGPFKFGNFTAGVNLTLVRNPNYWDQNLPIVDKLMFSIYDDDDLKNDFLEKKIHFLQPSLSAINITLDTIIDDPKFTVKELVPTSYQFIAVDNSKINLTMRKAISYAINYSYILKELRKRASDPYIRFKSFIPEGILYSNTSAFNVPYYNISKARQYLIDEGWPGTGALIADENISPGNDWEQLVTDGTPIAIYTLDSWGSPDFWINITLDPIPNYLKQIGVEVIFQPYWFPNDMFIAGWTYDYNDPSNDPFYYHSKWNEMNLNDSQIDQYIEDGIKETNPVTRKQIYYDFQEYLIEDIYPYIWTTHRIKYFVWVSNLREVQVDPFKILFKTAYFARS